MARLALSVLCVLALAAAASCTPISTTTSTNITVDTTTSVQIRKGRRHTSVASPSPSPSLSLSAAVPVSGRSPKPLVLSSLSPRLRAAVQATLRFQISTFSPLFASTFWANSKAERYFVSLVSSGRKLTIFVPTDRAYRRWASKVKDNCDCKNDKTNLSLNDLMAQQMVPRYLDLATLRKLRKGDKLVTMSKKGVRLVVKQTRPNMQLAIATGGKFVSFGVVKTAGQTGRGYAIYYLDNILATC